MSFLKEYTLLSELGQGGFAKVYKVRHDELGYIRAIRVLNETVTDEKSATYQKFLRECKVLLRLGNGSHPNIVHIYQPRLLESHALVEMDFVDGTDISHYLGANGNFLPAEEVLRMVEQMSSALAYCHEDIYKYCMDREADQLRDDPMDGSRVLIDEATRQRLIEKYKVIHNDIHSGNIMRREDGNFVLLDFGLAITGVDDVRNSSRHENGAVEFKSPEKWDDEAVLTEQSDVYSFGVVMYEYLAGRVPFPFDKSLPNRTEATFRLSKAHKEQTPPSIFELRKANYEAKYSGQEYQKDYPDWLEEAIMRCLEKNPAKRFRNGKELYEFVLKQLKTADENISVELHDAKRELENKCATIALLQDEIDRLKEFQVKEKETHHEKIEIQTAKRKPWRFIVLLLVGLAAVALLALNLLKRQESPTTTTHSQEQTATSNENTPSEEELLRKQHEIDNLKQEIESLNLRIADLQSQLDNATDPEDVTALNEALQQAQNDLEQAQQTITNLETVNREQADRIASFDETLRKKQNDIDNLTNRNNTLTNENNQLTRKNKELTNKNSDLERKYNELTVDYANCLGSLGKD